MSSSHLWCRRIKSIRNNDIQKWSAFDADHYIGEKMTSFIRVIVAFPLLSLMVFTARHCLVLHLVHSFKFRCFVRLFIYRCRPSSSSARRSSTSLPQHYCFIFLVKLHALAFSQFLSLSPLSPLQSHQFQHIMVSSCACSLGSVYYL